MIDVENIKNFYLYTSNVDMRFGIYAIQKILSITFTPIQILDTAFIFVGRDSKTVKIYYENEYGCWLFINKLKYYKFQVNKALDGQQITSEDLNYLLKGLELKSETIKKIGI